MTINIHHRVLHLSHVDLQLSGITPGVARAVADALPAAVAAEMGSARAPADRTLSLSSEQATIVTRTLAREIAARIRVGLATPTQGDA